MTKQRSTVASASSGLLAGVVLYGVIVLLGWNGPTSTSPWSTFFGPVAAALTAVVPGFVAGYLSGRSGFVIGATAGVLTSIVVSFLSATVNFPPYWEPEQITQAFAIQGFAYALAALLTNGVSGIAAAYLARAAIPSNNKLETDACNSSARRSA
jgi:MFS family permease